MKDLKELETTPDSSYEVDPLTVEGLGVSKENTLSEDNTKEGTEDQE